MNSQKAQFEALSQAYNTLPGLQCGECWGECCVSPTMTAIEFIYMMHGAMETLTHQRLLAFLTEPVKEHLFYQGNAHCRFQDMENGRCQNYDHRALACRLHGHEALRVYQTEEMEFCDKKPDHKQDLKKSGLDERLELIRLYNDQLNIPYSEPWYLCSFNLEGWLDFYYNPSLSEQRADLASLYETLHKELTLPEITNRMQLTTLGGLFNVIETLYMAIEQGDGNLALKCLNSILNDFPSTGSYYLEEAEQMKTILLSSAQDPSSDA